MEEKGLDLREDPLKGPCVNGITEMGVNSAEGVLSLLESGNLQRHQVNMAAFLKHETRISFKNCASNTAVFNQFLL